MLGRGFFIADPIFALLAIGSWPLLPVLTGSFPMLRFGAVAVDGEEWFNVGRSGGIAGNLGD
jgi:hypothetical protein